MVLRIGDYQQTPTTMMANQNESKNKNHINTVFSFQFINYMTDLLSGCG